MKAEEGIALLGAGVAAYALWRAYQAREGKEAPVIGGGISGARVSSAVTRLTEPLISVSLPSISLPSVSIPVSFPSLPGAEEVKEEVKLIFDKAKDVFDAAKSTAVETGKRIKGLVSDVKTAAIVGTAAAVTLPVTYVGGKAALAMGQAITKAPLVSVETLPALTPTLGAAAAAGTAAWAAKRTIEVGAGAAKSIGSQLGTALAAGAYQMKLRALESAVKKGKTEEELRRIFGAKQVEEWFQQGVLRYA